MDEMIFGVCPEQTLFDLSTIPDFVSVGFASTTLRDYSTLSVAEKEVLGPRASDVRRRHFAAGRHAARIAMSRIGIEDGEVLRGERGEPLWPDGIVGSITHAEDTAIAMVARRSDARAIGIDLERMRSVEEIESLVAFDDELIWLERSQGLRDRVLLELFATKESVYKALYPLVGDYFGFEAVRVGPTGLEGELQVTVVSQYLRRAGVPTSMQSTVRWSGSKVLASVVLPISGP